MGVCSRAMIALITLVVLGGCAATRESTEARTTAVTPVVPEEGCEIGDSLDVERSEHGLFGPSLLGGVAGAVVGSQLGHGPRGIALAVAGAVIGSHATRETFALRTHHDRRAEGGGSERVCGERGAR